MPYGPPAGYGAPGGFGGSPYMLPPAPQQDSSVSLMPMISQFFGMMMNMLVGVLGANGQPEPQPTELPDGTQNLPDTDPTDDSGNDDPNEGLDTNRNSDILQIVADNADDIPHRNGRITEKDLKDYLKDNPDLPDSTKEAIQNLVDNPELYNLLCLKSGNTAKQGFSTDVLDDSTDWDNLDIDELDSVDTDQVWDTLKGVNDKLKNIDGDASNGVSLEDIKKVALGQVDDPKLQDPEVQAAALKFLMDQDLQDGFKETDGFTGDGPAT
jgi:hypothetical protein